MTGSRSYAPDMRFKKSILVLAAVAASIGLLVIIYPWLEPARLLYDVHGIDVSHHQGKIDWPAVAVDGVGFAFIKATEGGDFVDPRFAENWKASAKAGIPRGAYHFFTQCRPATVQAEKLYPHGGRRIPRRCPLSSMPNIWAPAARPRRSWTLRRKLRSSSIS